MIIKGMTVTMIIIFMVFVLSMTPPFPSVLVIFHICIQGVCGYFFDNETITGTHYDVFLLAEL